MLPPVHLEPACRKGGQPLAGGLVDLGVHVAGDSRKHVVDRTGPAHDQEPPPIGPLDQPHIACHGPGR